MFSSAEEDNGNMKKIQGFIIYRIWYGDILVYLGRTKQPLQSRIRRGMSIDKACTTKDLRCHYFNIDGEEKSITQVCEDQRKDAELVSNRLKYGYSMHDALNKPKKVTKQGKAIVEMGFYIIQLLKLLESLDYQRKNLRSEDAWHRERYQTMHFHLIIDFDSL